MKTVLRRVVIVALVLSGAWVAGWAFLTYYWYHGGQAGGPVAATATKLGVKPLAPDVLPQEFVLKFHDATWEAICEYLQRNGKNDEVREEDARDRLMARIRRAKKRILDEAAEQYRDGDKHRDGWREQLDQQQDKIWDKADVTGDREQPHKAGKTRE